MENFLINYLLKNCVTLAKEFFSSGKATPEEGNNALNFLNLLDVKMGSGITTSNTGSAVATVSKESKDKTPREDTSKEDSKKELSANFFDTQSIITLLQTYLKAQDTQDNTLNAFQDNNAQSVTIEKFLQNVFSLLQEGESVQFLKEKSMGTISLVQMSERQKKTVETDQHPVIEIGKKTVETDQHPVIDHGNATENNAFIGYLASVLQQFNTLEKTGEKTENTKAENQEMNVSEYDIPQSIEVLKMFGKTVENSETAKVTDKMVKPLLNKTKMPINFEDENKDNKDVLKPSDVTVKLFPNIEVKKLNDQENVLKIISNESSSRESEEMNKNLSSLTGKTEKPEPSLVNSLPRFVSNQSLSGENEEMNKNISTLTAKTEKAVLSRDDDVPRIISKVSDKAANERAGADERQLLSQNDYTKTTSHPDKEVAKVLEKAPFASIMTDRIEKIVEQYANKSASMDMIVRLKIDEKETLLVGLKEQGQRVTVEVKTTNESMGNFLQSQKEEIARQLEGKNVYANIYVDVQNENSQKKDQRDNQKKQSKEQEKQDFSGFLDAVA